MTEARETILSVRNLKVNFSTPDGTVEAVRGIDLDVKAGETIGLADLPPDWRRQEGFTQQRGDAWHRSGSTPLLQVPSAIVPLAESPDRNVLINHAHPDVPAIKVAGSVPFALDIRLF